MVYVTIGEVYKELKLVKKELRDLRGSLVPIERVSSREHKELDAIEAQMGAGKATPWRKALKA